jgi:glycosyltransferase involved in cell wall biosynthesis
VSVVIPAFKPSWLDAAVDSVRAQTFADWEIIVVDDGSPEPVQLTHPDDVVLIRQANAGPGGARNRGVAYARGPLVAMLDADDRWHASKLDKQVALHEAEPDLVMSCTDLVVTDGTTLRRHRAGIRARGRFSGNRIPRERLFYENCVVCSSVMLRRDAFLRTPGMQEHRFMGEDYGLWLRLALLGPVGYIDEPLLERRQHGGSLMSKTLRAGTWFQEERVVYEELLRDFPELRNAAFFSAALARLDAQGGWAHLVRGEWEEARRALTRSVAADPLRPKAWVDLARAVLRVGRFRNLDARD